MRDEYEITDSIQILINEMTWLTEGPMGIKIAKPTFMGHKLDPVEFYYLVAALMVLFSTNP